MRVGGFALAAPEVGITARWGQLDGELQQLGRRARRSARQGSLCGVIERGRNLGVVAGGRKGQMSCARLRIVDDCRQLPMETPLSISAGLRGDRRGEHRVRESDALSAPHEEA